MLKILLIEDEFIIAKDVQITLQKNDFSKVDIAKNYEKANSLFSNNNYDLIITDINLNDTMDGIQIIEKFMSIQQVPVVYLTAYSNPEIVERAKNTMPFAYILKPFNANQLKVTINLALLNFKKHTDNIQQDEQNNDYVELLTSREKEVLVVLASGKTSKEIGEILNITALTVEKHKQNIKRKLNLNTIGELINFTMTSRLFKLSNSN